ncbi:MAG TPA: LysR family transcriptional regulator, partial [Terriglobales bacterium]|nr:LysR family transcriptional regulator [Terriglobales bacterium]
LFIAVAEAGSIAKAAAQCHTVASAVSKRLSDLERSFHTPLLARSSKGVTLTPAGHSFLVRARGVLNQATQLEEELRAFSSGVRGQVRVFANISAIVQFLPRALAKFLAQHKDVRIDLEEHVSSVVAQAVADRVADVGIVSDIPAVRQLELLPFREDQLVLVMRRRHPLAGRKSVRFADALAYDFVGLHSNSSLHYRLLREASEIGRPLNLRIQVTSFDAVCAMVAAGLGVGIVPRGAATPYTRSLGLASVRLNESWARRRLHICVRSLAELSPAARLLVDHLAGHRRAR